MKVMGVLPSFTGVAGCDAWAPYDTYTGPEHQLCCAHALRELQAVTDAAPGGRWCRASQAAGALTAMQDLVREAIGQGRAAVDPAALAAQDGQAEAEGIRLPAHDDRRPAVLRHPQLPVHRCQARPGFV